MLAATELSALTEQTLMILPRPRLSMWRTAACDNANALSTLVCRMRWYSASGKSTKRHDG